MMSPKPAPIPFRTRRILAVVAVVVATARAASAAPEADDPELDALDAAFAAKVEALGTPVARRYLEVLEELARKLASSGRPTAPVAAERRRIRALLESGGIASLFQAPTAPPAGRKTDGDPPAGDARRQPDE